MDEAQFSLNNLPEEIHNQISSHLSSPDFCQLGQVCQSLRRYYNPRSFKHVVVRQVVTSSLNELRLAIESLTPVPLTTRLIPPKVFLYPSRYSWFAKDAVKHITFEHTPIPGLKDNARIEELIEPYISLTRLDYDRNPRLNKWNQSFKRCQLPTDRCGEMVLNDISPIFRTTKSTKAIVCVDNIYNKSMYMDNPIIASQFIGNSLDSPFFGFFGLPLFNLEIIKIWDFCCPHIATLAQLEKSAFSLNYDTIFSRMSNLEKFVYRIENDVLPNHRKIIQAISKCKNSGKLEKLQHLAFYSSPTSTTAWNFLSILSPLPDVFKNVDLYMLFPDRSELEDLGNVKINLPQLTKLYVTDPLAFFEVIKCNPKKLNELTITYTENPSRVFDSIMTMIESKISFEAVRTLRVKNYMIRCFKLFPNVEELSLHPKILQAPIQISDYSSENLTAPQICRHFFYKHFTKRFPFGSDMDFSNVGELMKISEEAERELRLPQNFKKALNFMKSEQDKKDLKSHYKDYFRGCVSTAASYLPMGWKMELYYDAEFSDEDDISYSDEMFNELIYLYVFEMIMEYFPKLKFLIVGTLYPFDFYFTLHQLIKKHKTLKEFVYSTYSPTISQYTLEKAFPTPRNQLYERIQAHTHHLSFSSNPSLIQDPDYMAITETAKYSVRDEIPEIYLLDVEAVREGYVAPDDNAEKGPINLVSISIKSPIYTNHKQKIQYRAPSALQDEDFISLLGGMMY